MSGVPIYNTIIFNLVLVDTRLTSNANVNGNGNHFLHELLMRIGIDRQHTYDVRIGTFDGAVGYMFRNPLDGGFGFANPKLDVS